MLLPAGAAFAAGGGMPQLVTEDMAPQLVWLVILFLVLYVVLSTVAMPRIASTLEARDAKVSGDVAAAAKASDDARHLVEAYQKKLADARGEARRMASERAEADAAAAAARLGELAEKLNARAAEAEKRISQQRGDVMAGLEQMAADLAQSAYTKLAGRPADKGALDAKVSTALKGTSR
jgi:F-type H+-transporting ATPase subunit b